MQNSAQLSFKLRPRRGGTRPGAGRPPKFERAMVPHEKRPDLTGREPVHVTLKVMAGVGYLRAQRQIQAIETSFQRGKLRFGLHLAHYSVQGMHLHLIVEPLATDSLSRGMQGLAVRLARALNKLVARRGKVFADRFYARALRSRRDAANVLRYVLRNFQHHTSRPLPPGFVDPCSSEPLLHAELGPESPIVEERTWILRKVAAALGPPD